MVPSSVNLSSAQSSSVIISHHQSSDVSKVCLALTWGTQYTDGQPRGFLA
jgi:hypothetical protein